MLPKFIPNAGRNVAKNVNKRLDRDLINISVLSFIVDFIALVKNNKHLVSNNRHLLIITNN